MKSTLGYESRRFIRIINVQGRMMKMYQAKLQRRRMSREGKLVDDPMVWKEWPMQKVESSKKAEILEEVASNDASSEEESEEDMDEVTGFMMLNRRGLIARVLELKKKIQKMKKKEKTLKEELQEKSQLLETLQEEVRENEKH